MGIYDFSVEKPNGEMVSLKDYEGKVLMIVNTATKCGFTPQYEDLQKIYDTYKEQGLEILEFPCNQFAEQAPGTDEEIAAFCTGRFFITFPRFKKCNVKGENAIPLYKYLITQKGFEGFKDGSFNPLAKVLEVMLKKDDPDYKLKPDVKWNFTKFIVDRSGNVVARFEPTTKMNKVEDFVKNLL